VLNLRDDLVSRHLAVAVGRVHERSPQSEGPFAMRLDAS
jgi:hypothetical protein